MPKLKLSSFEISLVADALKAHYQSESAKYFKLLGEALGEDFDTTKTSSVNDEACTHKHQEALAVHEQLRDVYSAKINLFEVEHRGMTLSEEELTEFNQLQQKYWAEESLLLSLNDTFREVQIIENLADITKSKVHGGGIIIKYDGLNSDRPVLTDTTDDEPYPPTWNWGD